MLTLFLYSLKAAILAILECHSGLHTGSIKYLHINLHISALNHVKILWYIFVTTLGGRGNFHHAAKV
jgi:hypothetical protein